MVLCRQTFMICFVVDLFHRVEQLSKYSDDRRTDNTHLVENLKSHAQNLDKSLKMEKEKSCMLQ